MIRPMRRAFTIVVSWLLVIGHLSASLSPHGSLPSVTSPRATICCESAPKTAQNEVVGLYYLRARYLNAANGRFWNADSFEGVKGEPTTLHKYLYCGSDSVNCSDPSGRLTLTETLAVTAVVSTLAVIAVNHSFVASRGYAVGLPDVYDPNKPYKEIIERAARANNLPPELVGAIVAYEAIDLNGYDWSGDAISTLVFGGNHSVGIGQVQVGTVEKLHPEMKGRKAAWFAFQPENSIFLCAEYLRLLIQMSQELPYSSIAYNASDINLARYTGDAASWSPDMIEMLAYSYTQKPWLVDASQNTGKASFIIRNNSGDYGPDVFRYYSFLKGRFSR